MKALRISMNSPTGYFATSHFPAALLSANKNTATSMKPIPASADVGQIADPSRKATFEKRWKAAMEAKQ